MAARCDERFGAGSALAGAILALEMAGISRSWLSISGTEPVAIGLVSVDSGLGNSGWSETGSVAVAGACSAAVGLVAGVAWSRGS